MPEFLIVMSASISINGPPNAATTTLCKKETNPALEKQNREIPAPHPWRRARAFPNHPVSRSKSRCDTGVGLVPSLASVLICRTPKGQPHKQLRDRICTCMFGSQSSCQQVRRNSLSKSSLQERITPSKLVPIVVSKGHKSVQHFLLVQVSFVGFCNERRHQNSPNCITG